MASEITLKFEGSRNLKVKVKVTEMSLKIIKEMKAMRSRNANDILQMEFFVNLQIRVFVDLEMEVFLNFVNIERIWG